MVSLKRILPLLTIVAAMCLYAQERPVKIVLVGDSTVNDEGGWGPGLRASFGPAVEVVNLARNGRSSKSFRAEGLWQPALDAKADYILIQFGHNDVPGKGPDRETGAETTYRENMARYVAEARESGATPVLVTSIVRRNFAPDGTIVADSLVPYVNVVRRLAAEKGIALLDLYSLTKEQAERLGPKGCEEINALEKNGKSDHTHLGPKGREEIGAMVARELVKVEPRLVTYLRK